MDKRQTNLNYAIADGSARDRRRQICRVVRDLEFTSAAQRAFTKLLLLLIFEQTRDGLGDAWTAEDNVVMGHILGPECARSMFLRIRTALVDAEILSVEKRMSTDGHSTYAYKIVWTGVYGLRGLPVPPILLGDESAENTVHAVEPPSTVWTPRPQYGRPVHSMDAPSTVWTGDFSGGCAPHARAAPTAHADAGVRARVVVSVMSSSSTTTLQDSVWNQTLELVRRIKSAIYSKWPTAKIDGESKKFMGCVAIIATVLQPTEDDWDGWIKAGIDATASNRSVQHPTKFLRGTLANLLASYLGLCDESESKAFLGQLQSYAWRLLKNRIRELDPIFESMPLFGETSAPATARTSSTLPPEEIADAMEDMAKARRALEGERQ